MCQDSRLPEATIFGSPDCPPDGFLWLAKLYQAFLQLESVGNMKCMLGRQNSRPSEIPTDKSSMAPLCR